LSDDAVAAAAEVGQLAALGLGGHAPEDVRHGMAVVGQVQGQVQGRLAVPGEDHHLAARAVGLVHQVQDGGELTTDVRQADQGRIDA
jgi:hypothetical protein